MAKEIYDHQKQRVEVILTPLKEIELTEEHIGMPLLYNNKGHNELCILCKIRPDDYIETYYAGAKDSFMARKDGLFKIELKPLR